MVTLSNLTYGGVLERHPGLKVAVLESGGGWIAHWMDRLNEFEESYDWAAAPMSLTPRSTSSGSAGSASIPVSAPRGCSDR